MATKDLPTSPRFLPYDFLLRCKFSSTLTTRQPRVEFTYTPVLTLPATLEYYNGRQNKNISFTRIELTTSALLIIVGVRGYLQCTAPLTGGCSEGLYAFRYFFKKTAKMGGDCCSPPWFTADYMYVWPSHIARVRIKQVRLQILLVVSRTGKNNFALSPFAPEKLVSRDGFGSPVPRQPAHLHTRGESGAYLLDSSRVPRRRPFTYVKLPYAIGSVLSLSGHAIAYRWGSLPRVRRHRASKPQGCFKRVLPWQVTMHQ